MLTLHIEAANVSELHSTLAAILHRDVQPKAEAPKPIAVVTPQAAVTGTPAEGAVSGASANAEVVKAKPGRPKKTEQAQPAVAQNTGSGGQELSVAADAKADAVPTPPADPATPSDKPLTMDDVKTAAMAVTAKFGNVDGMAKLREILQSQGGIKLLRDVPADKFAAVKAACEAAVK